MANIRSSNDSAQQDEIDQLRREAKKLKDEMAAQRARFDSELKAAKEMLDSKVNASPQFQQLKKILVQKNQQLKDARDQLKLAHAAVGMPEEGDAK
jgi:uncharacterized coiled-coil DUF342 family protein